MKDLNINLDTLNLIEEKVENSIEQTGTGDNFLFLSPSKQRSLSLKGKDLKDINYLGLSAL